jgi:endo-1,4-beta-D-glucanase Y
MVNAQLLQIKIDPNLKKTLKTLADHKGISVSAYVKMMLTKISREERIAMSKEKIAYAFPHHASIPETNDPEDEVILKHEKNIISSLEKHLSNPKNIAKIIPLRK